MLSFQEEDYPVFACPECSSMRGVLSLQPAQEARTIKRLLCHHSKVLSHLINNWRNLWKIDGTEVVSSLTILFYIATYINFVIVVLGCILYTSQLLKLLHLQE